MDKQRMAEIRKGHGGAISPAELDLLEDIQGFINFGIRNGLSFLSIMSALGHDLRQLRLYEFDLNKAAEDGFLPKVSGYSQVTEESVGEEPEAE